MKLTDLQYSYPEELIALEPARPTRVMWVDSHEQPIEISVSDLIDRIPAGDLLVLNDTKVLKRRVFTDDGLEILFLDKKIDSTQHNTWSVLFPSKKFRVGDEIILPNQAKMILLEKGLPQKVKVVPEITESDFESFGELPLPPYIQKARDDRHTVDADDRWYQTAWAEKAGSFAAPTASLHFSESDIAALIQKGVQVLKITLHVGLGTFLPVKTDNLDSHQMHGEVYQVDQVVWDQISAAKKDGLGIWALGTTVTRTLETIARTGELSGESKLLLQVGSEFKIVSRLLTNFHQPESTLLALVAGFVGLDRKSVV
jgi:S-adenosylmethionine:tRNA ribosyltransferase-isomerase